MNMKKHLKKLISAASALTLTVMLSACSNTNDENPTETPDSETGKTIAVVAKGESHAFWQSVKSGAGDAAKKHGYKITFRGPASESAKDIPSQQEMVQTALSNNVDALVIATIGEGFTSHLTQAFDKKIPVVQFDSGIWEKDIQTLDSQNKNPIISSVATSNKKAAALAAEHFFEALKEDIAASQAPYVIGIIQHDETQTGIDRADGFAEKFKELAEKDDTTKGKIQIEKEVKPGDADNAYKTALEALAEKNASAIFMSNEGVVKQVYDAIAAAGTKYDKIKFCGFDAGSKQIEWMKKENGPALIGAVAQDSYQIGYSAVEQAITAVKNGNAEKEVAISGAWWNKENVDEMINKKLVYEG